MKEIYRIKQGEVYNDAFNEKIRFCIVYNDDGLIKLELYYDPQKEYTDQEVHSMFKKSFRINGMIVENKTIQADDLHLSHVNTGKGFLKFVCYGKVKIIEKEHDYYGHERELQKNINMSETIYSIEVEGMKMLFSDFTHRAEVLNFESIGRTINIERDYTQTSLCYKKEGELSTRMYMVEIRKTSAAERCDNIEISFMESTLEYAEYLKFKTDFICFLSLINGAEIRVRREEYSKPMSPNHTVIYSFKNIINKEHNSYIPINEHSYIGEDILQYFFLFCFDNYRQWNEKIDFNYTVRLLCNSTQASSIEQSFITLIVALERLASLNMNLLPQEKKFLLPEKEFEEIRRILTKEIDLYVERNNLNTEQKNEKNEAYNKLKNIISNSNRADKAVRHKFKYLIEVANITMNSDIRNIIERVRHTSIHMGDIEKWPKNVTNYLTLDELIRDIILNMIGYKKARVTRTF